MFYRESSMILYIIFILFFQVANPFCSCFIGNPLTVFYANFFFVLLSVFISVLNTKYEEAIVLLSFVKEVYTIMSSKEEYLHNQLFLAFPTPTMSKEMPTKFEKQLKKKLNKKKSL